MNSLFNFTAQCPKIISIVVHLKGLLYDLISQFQFLLIKCIIWLRSYAQHDVTIAYWEKNWSSVPIIIIRAEYFQNFFL